MQDPLQAILGYHERTRHRPERYAPGPGFLDWANQPDPFRRWEGAPVTELPLGADRLATPYEDLFRSGGLESRPLSLESVGVLFELSLGLSAWKGAGGASWALRCNPSSGNLHPTEGYLVATGFEGVAGGVHHYSPYLHALELRCAATPALPDGHVIVGLSSVHWREAWKYGERAYRYCQHDIGHAIAALRMAAAAIGWKAVLLESASDGDVSALLGLDRRDDFGDAEAEHPDCLLLVGPDPRPRAVAMDDLCAASTQGEWTGVANRLSAAHRAWPAIEDAAHAARKPRTPPTVPVMPDSAPTHGVATTDEPAADIIRQRRSAQSFDPRINAPLQAFSNCVASLSPVGTPWDALPWSPLVHPVFIVHRVEGLTPGLYALPRSPDAIDGLRAAMSPAFAWELVEETAGVPLYLLQEGDGRAAMKMISCHQDIAGDSAFTLGMLAEFEPVLRERGAWWYRRLFWECGVLGQRLYLEAEASGLRGTGIGCYFDDLFHELLGLGDRRFQSLYHFTVGAPLVDPRLQTAPPYGHRRG